MSIGSSKSNTLPLSLWTSASPPLPKAKTSA
jgi:hypothetical protein